MELEATSTFSRGVCIAATRRALEWRWLAMPSGRARGARHPPKMHCPTAPTPRHHTATQLAGSDLGGGGHLKPPPPDQIATELLGGVFAVVVI